MFWTHLKSYVVLLAILVAAFFLARPYVPQLQAWRGQVVDARAVQIPGTGPSGERILVYKYTLDVRDGSGDVRSVEVPELLYNQARKGTHLRKKLGAAAPELE